MINTSLSFDAVHDYSDIYGKVDFQLEKIPKHIHFIWVGSPIKAQYFATIQECRRQNPDYSVYLWVNEPSLTEEQNGVLQACGITVKNITQELREGDSFHQYCQQQMDRCINMGFKADIIRYFAVWKYGGIYSDIG